MCKSTLLAACLSLTLAGAALAQDYPAYRQVVTDTANMVSNSEVGQLARKHGLEVLNLTWEDTGRYKGSCVGPNISDVTLQVQLQNPRTQQYELTCMPVIRFPNFEDKTADLKLDDFYLLVGNQTGQDLRKVSLREYLDHPRSYMSWPDTFKGPHQSLLAKRDSHALVSAQACFLPIPKAGEAQFNPVIFNYVSTKGDPAVLTILATREGTSMTIIDNVRDGFPAGQTWGQRLFFNHNGQRASLTGQRQSDFAATTSAIGPTASAESGLNMVLLIQVPLKQKQPMARNMVCCDACAPPPGSIRRACDVEAAVIGHGKVEGPFTEVDNLAIERDPNFPVRVTVQFYQATSNGAVSSQDMQQIASQIGRVYQNASYVGSLVTGGDSGRPTEYTGDKHEPKDWWSSFWQRYQDNTGLTSFDAQALWQKLHLKARDN